MALQITWSPKAASHLEQICEYIAQDSRVYARIFAEKVFAILHTTAQFPASGRVVPEFDRPALREKIFGNYRIVYRLKPEKLEVVAICHGAKQMERLL